MLVHELIAKLKELPHDAHVVLPGYEGGVSCFGSVEQVEIVLNVNKEWYYGKHEIYDPDRYSREKSQYNIATAVYLH